MNVSDQINARGSDSKFTPHPVGQFVAQCVDVVNLGETVQTFPGTPDYLVQKCAIVFRTGERNEETGEFIDISQEFTVSLGAKANLRKLLEPWRGAPYEAKQIEEGVPLHKLTGNHGLLTVAQKTSGKGRKYALITACVGIPKQMESSVTKYLDYKRADYWAERAKGYAELVKKFRTEHATTTTDDSEFDESQQSVEPDDLPF